MFGNQVKLATHCFSRKVRGSLPNLHYPSNNSSLPLRATVAAVLFFALALSTSSEFRLFNWIEIVYARRQENLA